MIDRDIIVIGAGPAGLAAAIKAKEAGCESVLILEREQEAGGILQQCIHNGFGLHVFGEELTGPEYAHRFISEATRSGVEIKLNTMVLAITRENSEVQLDETPNVAYHHHLVTCINQTEGVATYRAKALILAMGCRERPRGALNIPGSRPAGIFTAGAAQRFVNMEGYMPGKRIVILGSGDIGLIMARRLTLEGAMVLMVCELLPYSSGLNRNIVQCLEDYGIPLKLSHTVVKIHGRERVEAVTIAKVDEHRRPVPDSFETIPCDTLLLSVGLIPENELSLEAGVLLDSVTGGPVVDKSRETIIPGIFACGNVVHVHDLVDNVTEESRIAGLTAASYVRKGPLADKQMRTIPGSGIRYIVPQVIKNHAADYPLKLYFRVDAPYENITLVVKCGDRIIQKKHKRKLTSGEMEHVTLQKCELELLETTEDLVIELLNDNI